MIRLIVVLPMLAVTTQVYAEVADKVPGYLSMVAWPLAVVLMLVHSLGVAIPISTAGPHKMTKNPSLALPEKINS